RLQRILISESAHLIWRLRSERVMGHVDEEGWTHHNSEVRPRWYAVVYTRSQQDMAVTGKQ
ncbi:hypothetical protein C8Q72DRAFT_754428, partial [Fomitopsis betulina]